MGFSKEQLGRGFAERSFSGRRVLSKGGVGNPWVDYLLSCLTQEALPVERNLEVLIIKESIVHD